MIYSFFMRFSKLNLELKNTFKKQKKVKNMGLEKRLVKS